MWTSGTTLMIARLTGSTLCANHNLASFFACDQRSLSTTTSPNIVTKMRDLRARSPYALFLKDNYSVISAKYPDLKLVDISKKVAEVWKSLPDDKKQTYSKKSQDQKVLYEQEKQRLSPNDLQIVDANDKARRIEHRIKKSIQQLPLKRPRSAYIHFLTTLDRGEADIGTFMRGAAQRWAHMTDQDKQAFENLHQEEKQNYVKSLVAWAASNEQKTKSPKTRRSTSASSAKKTKSPTTRRSASASNEKKIKSPTQRSTSASTETKDVDVSPKSGRKRQS